MLGLLFWRSLVLRLCSCFRSSPSGRNDAGTSETFPPEQITGYHSQPIIDLHKLTQKPRLVIETSPPCHPPSPIVLN